MRPNGRSRSKMPPNCSCSSHMSCGSRPARPTWRAPARSRCATYCAILCAEALDVLQAMNTGHDGSMSTIHANSPREALTRLENMVGMTGINLSLRAVRTQISAAVHLIVQVDRMRDGIRRIIQIMEVVGMEGDVITTQELFNFQFQGETTEGMLRGTFKSNGIRPNFLTRAEYYGLDRPLLEVI